VINPIRWAAPQSPGMEREDRKGLRASHRGSGLPRLPCWRLPRPLLKSLNPGRVSGGEKVTASIEVEPVAAFRKSLDMSMLRFMNRTMASPGPGHQLR